MNCIATTGTTADDDAARVAHEGLVLEPVAHNHPIYLPSGLPMFSDKPKQNPEITPSSSGLYLERSQAWFKLIDDIRSIFYDEWQSVKHADLKKKLDNLHSSASRTKDAAEQWNSTPTYFNVKYETFQSQFEDKDFLVFEYSARWVGKKGQLWNRLGLDEEDEYEKNPRFKKGTISHHRTVDAASYAAKIKGCVRGWFGYSSYWDAAHPTVVPTDDQGDFIAGIAHRFKRKSVNGHMEFQMNKKKLKTFEKFYDSLSGPGSGWKFVQLKSDKFPFEIENYKPGRHNQISKLKAKELPVWFAVAELSLQGPTKKLIHGSKFPSYEDQRKQDWATTDNVPEDPIGDVKAPHWCYLGRLQDMLLDRLYLRGYSPDDEARYDEEAGEDKPMEEVHNEHVQAYFKRGTTLVEGLSDNYIYEPDKYWVSRKFSEQQL